MANPRGLAFGSVSGISGRPVELEKRTVTGVGSVFVKCGALESAEASFVGVKDPVSMMPRACAGRKPGCSLKTASNEAMMSVLRLTRFSSFGRGMMGTQAAAIGDGLRKGPKA
jgi:hypothetical protein